MTVRGTVFLGIGAVVGAGSQAWIVMYTIAATAIVLAFFVVDIARNAPETFAAIVGIALLAVIFDLVWKRMRGVVQLSAFQAS